jgi:predicted nucleic acid-binding protein
LIVAAAEFADCRCLISEDLDDGQIIRGVKIKNPFKKPNIKECRK